MVGEDGGAGIDCSLGSVEISGGTVTATGGSSFETEDTLKEGADGVTLLKYQPKKGVIVPKLTRSLEQGESMRLTSPSRWKQR